MACKTAKGTAFSTDAASGDIYYRTDEQAWNEYDGSNWVSERYCITRHNATVTTDGSVVLGTIGNEFDAFMDYSTISTRVSTTNDSDNYWTVAFTSFDMTLGTSTDYYTIVTDSDSADTWVDNSGTPSVTAPSVTGHVVLVCSATGTPGNLALYAGQYFRHISS